MTKKHCDFHNPSGIKCGRKTSDKSYIRLADKKGNAVLFPVSLCKTHKPFDTYFIIDEMPVENPHVL